MKFLSVLMVLMAVVSVRLVNAQMKIEVGAKGGLNYAGINLNSAGKLVSTNYNSGVTYHIGGYALLRFTKFAIQPEIIFSRQGQYYSDPYNSNLHTGLSYINVPVMIKYYVVGGLNLQAGPQFGLLAGSKGDLLKLDNNGNIVGRPMTGQDLKSYLNSTDFSIAFGAGLDLPFGGSLTIRYNVGVSDINKNTHAESLPNSTTSSISTAYARNQVLQVSIGYRIRKLGK